MGKEGGSYPNIVFCLGNRIRGEKKEENVNVIGLEKVMNKYLKGTEIVKSK